MDYLQQYQLWRGQNLPQAHAAELEAMEKDKLWMEGAFGAELQFGTAGMRGIMGMGTNRLNRYTVRRAAQGMAAWLSASGLAARCAIGYDTRHHSREFAEVCAVAMAEQGIQAWVYAEPAPTPMLSFAVRELGCGCGIVISASHNAGAYNGIKCYGPDGCQMTDEPAEQVVEKIQHIAYFDPEQDTYENFLAAGKIIEIGPDLWEAYYQRVMRETLAPQQIAEAKLHAVYTPLCGTGNKPVREMLRRLGAQVTVVSCQEQPDGDFKTCEYPNPETDAALNESYKVAAEVHPDFIFGTDPDCDRVAVAVPDAGGWRKFTGNELGVLLLDYILKKRTEARDLPTGAEAIRSIVSTPMADRVAAYYGCQMKAVLTGFKYIGGEILRLEGLGEEDRFIFGFEESCGYLKGTYARDKDAVIASVLLCELAADLKLAGKTLLQHLNELYAQFGFFAARVQSVELSGNDAMEKAAGIMKTLREQCPTQIAGIDVTSVSDYLKREMRVLPSGEVTPITLPKSNVLALELGDKGSIIVRPSGTEPKVKLYYTAVGESAEAADALLGRYQAQMQAFLPK